MSKDSRARARRHRKPVRSAAPVAPVATVSTFPRPPKRVGTMALWIMTPFGVLMPALRPVHTYNPAEDARDLQVRGRERAYLDRFREMYCPELGESLHFPNQDYPWKAYVSRDDLARATARMVLEIDSEVFKPLTDKQRGVGDPRLASRLHSFYNSVWSSHLHYGDGTSSYNGGGKWASSMPGKGGSQGSKGNGGTSGATEFWNGTGSRNPERCKTQGHWFSSIQRTCLDCGAPKPENWREGDDPVYPQSPLGSWGEDNTAEWDPADWDKYLKDYEDNTDIELEFCPVCGRKAGSHKTDCELRDVEVLGET